MQMIEMYNGPDACSQCLGWKRVANSDDQESWKYWAELPARSSIAVAMGIVKPIECPKCGGTGKEPQKQNTLVIIGWLGDYTAFLNIPEDEAVKRYKQRFGWDTEPLTVKTIAFSQMFEVYDAWEIDEQNPSPDSQDNAA